MIENDDFEFNQDNRLNLMKNIEVQDWINKKKKLKWEKLKIKKIY